MKRSKLHKKNNVNYNSAVERYKKKKRKEIFVIGTLLTIILSIVLFANSSYVKIKNINIIGIEQLSREDIIKLSGVTADTKIWKIKEEDIKNTIIDNFNIISEINVEKKLLNTINITIKEKKLIAKELNENSNYDIILETGETYNGIINNDYSLPIIENFKENQEKRNKVIKNLLELKPEVLSSISEIVNDKDNKELLLIYMKDGQRVKVHSNNFSQKLNYYFEISKYIEDKNNTILNLVNGSYLETKKSIIEKDAKIKKILEKSNNTNSSKEEKNSKNDKDKKFNKDKEQEDINSETRKKKSE